MTKRDKRLSRIAANVRNVSLEDFEALIKQFGYIKESGRHPKARIGNKTMPYEKENPVKATLVQIRIFKLSPDLV